MVKTSTIRKTIDKVNKEIKDSKPALEREVNIKIELLKSIQKDLSIRVMELEQQTKVMAEKVKKITGRMGL